MFLEVKFSSLLFHYNWVYHSIYHIVTAFFLLPCGNFLNLALFNDNWYNFYILVEDFFCVFLEVKFSSLLFHYNWVYHSIFHIVTAFFLLPCENFLNLAIFNDNWYNFYILVEEFFCVFLEVKFSSLLFHYNLGVPLYISYCDCFFSITMWKFS